MIVLVRHGETDDNAKRVMQLPEAPLSAAGVAQARQLAARLAQLGVARILCSDFLRARMTAEPLVEETGAPITFAPLLQERNFGDLRGVAYADLPCDPFAPGYAPPGGESWEAFHARVDAAFAEVLAVRRREAGNLVVVTHGLVCSALVQRHARVASGVALPLRFDNTSVTLLEPESPHLARLVNCCDHLASAGNTRGGAIA
jgi:broad specificity phosphatase PhoE